MTDGVAGHASLPKMGDNALLKLAPLLERLGARQPSYAITDVPAAFLRGLGEDPDDPAAAVERLAAADPRLATMFEPMLGVTFTPTRAAASEKVNVIPSRAEVHVDCRVPPGLGEDEVRRAIAEVLGGDGSGFRVEFTEQVVGNGSPLDSPLRDAIDGWIADNDPGAVTVPVILPGFTDSRWFRNDLPRLRRVRLLPAPPSVAAGVRAARARRRRAHRRARPRLRGALLRRRHAHAARLSESAAAADEGRVSVLASFLGYYDFKEWAAIWVG